MENTNMTYLIEHPDYVNKMNQLALRLLNEDKKVYTVSSLQDKEGKTTTAQNLAFSLVKLHKKVCVVDVDMLNKKENDSSNSLQTYLLVENDLNQIINKQNEFDIITSDYSDSSATLLSSARFAEMVEQLKEKYDFVLLDAPSLNTHVDAMLVSQQSNALILVVEEGKNSKDKLEGLLLTLKRNNIPVLGTVLNKISNSRTLGFKPSKRQGSGAY